MAYGVDVKMITGDHKLIAQETCRALGMGSLVHTAEVLPSYEVGHKVPADLHERYGTLVLQADGFAQVWHGGFDC